MKRLLPLALGLLLALAPGLPVAAGDGEKEPGATLVVTLEDEEGRPVVDLPVAVGHAEEPREGMTGISPRHVAWRDGRLVVDHLPPDTRRVRIAVENYVPVVLEDVALVPGVTTDLGSVVVRHGPSIRGVVTARGRPVAGAEVRVRCTPPSGWAGGEWRRVTTDEAGRFLAGNLVEPGRCHVVVEAPGFAPWETEDASPGSSLSVDLRPPGVITGCAIVGERRRPARGMRVTAMRLRAWAEPETVEATADGAGCFRLEGLRGGSWDVRLLPRAVPVPGPKGGPSADEAASAVENALPRVIPGVAVAPGRKTDLGTVVLDEGITLSGTVFDGETGFPLPGREVRAGQGEAYAGLFFVTGARSLVPENGSTLVTDSEGRFRVGGVAPGTVAILVEDDPLEKHVFEIPGGAGEVSIDVPVFTHGTLEGRILLPDGRPAAGCPVSAQHPNDRDRSVTGRTDAEGRFRLEDVWPGRAILEVDPPPRAQALPLRLDVLVQPPGTTRLEDLVLPPHPGPVRLSGRVLLGDRPIAATLRFRSAGAIADGGTVATETGTDGSYSVELTGGRWKVFIEGTGRDGEALEASLPLVVPAERPLARRDLVLPAGVLLGTISGEDGTPREGTTVQLWPASGDLERVPEEDASMETRCGKDGSFRFEDVPRGRWWVAVEMDECRVPVVSRPVSVGSRAVEVHGIVPDPVRLVVRVVDEAGQPLGDAVLGLLATGDEAFPAPLALTLVDEEGFAILPAPPAADVFLAAWVPHRGIAVDPLVVPGPGERRSREMVVPRGPRVWLEVTADDRPATGAEVIALAREGGPDLAVSWRMLAGSYPWRDLVAGDEGPGRIVLPALPPGSWRALVVAGGRCAIARFRTPGGDPLVVKVELGDAEDCEF